VTAEKLEKEAVEASEAYRKDSITNGDNPVLAGCYSESFKDGYLAAATARDKEIEELRDEAERLRARCASLKHALKLTQELLNSDEKEIEELLARVKDLEEYANLAVVPYGFRDYDEEARLKELRSRLMVQPLPLPLPEEPTP